MNEIFLFAIVYLKKISSSFLIWFFIFSLFAISIGISIYEDYQTSLSIFLFLSPYLFLFSTTDMIKEEIEKGHLDNRIYFIVSKEKILIGKTVGILIISISFFLIGCLAISIIGVFKGDKIFIHEKFLASLLIGIYYIFMGLFLGFLLKGASNALFAVFLQILSFISILKLSPSFFMTLEKGIFTNFYERVCLFFLLSIFPNFITIKSIEKNFYFILLNSIILFLLIIYLYKRIEFKKD